MFQVFLGVYLKFLLENLVLRLS